MRHPAASPRLLAFAARSDRPPGIGSLLRGLLIGTDACFHVAKRQDAASTWCPPRVADARHLRACLRQAAVPQRDARLLASRVVLPLLAAPPAQAEHASHAAEKSD